MDRVVVSWSGGKDAALGLYELLRDPDYEVSGLVTTVNEAYDRVTMHGVRRELVAAQADALGLDLRVVELPESHDYDTYAERMLAVHEAYAAAGVDAIAFADLHLEDVRNYRESRLAETDLRGLWPIWGRETAAVAEQVVDLGFRPVVACVDASVLDAAFAGRVYDRELLDELPDGVDPCGENGEFHTLVADGPDFEAPLVVERGEVLTRELGEGSFHYRDLWLAEG